MTDTRNQGWETIARPRRPSQHYLHRKQRHYDTLTTNQRGFSGGAFAMFVPVYFSLTHSLSLLKPCYHKKNKLRIKKKDIKLTLKIIYSRRQISEVSQLKNTFTKVIKKFNENQQMS